MQIADLNAPEEQIHAYLARFASPPRELVGAFIAKGRRKLLAKGEPLVHFGETEHRIAFLHSGIVRYHVVHPETGEEVTKDFSFAPGFSLSFGSAVRDCAVTLWPASLWFQVVNSHLEWQKLGRKFAERLYLRKEDRELAFLLQSADERYDALLALFPPEIEDVPQHLLASYIGVAPESLSRLKRRRKK